MKINYEYLRVRYSQVFIIDFHETCEYGTSLIITHKVKDMDFYQMLYVIVQLH